MVPHFRANLELSPTPPKIVNEKATKNQFKGIFDNSGALDELHTMTNAPINRP